MVSIRKQVISYRGFRLSRMHEPRFCHVKLLFGWVVYFALFFLTESAIPARMCRPVHCALDDKIPFCELFLIPYVGWYGLIVFSLVYFLRYDTENFRGLQTFLIVTQVVGIACYILWPSRQDLRPEVFARDNMLTRGVALLYDIDTNTGVCPSMHVAYSLGMASAWLKEREVSWGWKLFVVVFVILVCASTAFIKQHSVLDTLAALPVCLLAEWVAYGKSYWRKRFRRGEN